MTTFLVLVGLTWSLLVLVVIACVLMSKSDE